MTSEKQIAANRRNALESTGPRTLEGKAHVARNAVKHGLLSQDILIAGEDADDLAGFRDAMMAELAPEGQLECLLADRVVSAAWRLRRAARMEQRVVEDKLERNARARQRSPSLYLDDLENTADRVAASLIQHSDTYGKICRYESHIERGMYRALHELERHQAARQGRQVTPPMVLDVDVDVSGLPSDRAINGSAKQSHLAEQAGPAESASPPASSSATGAASATQSAPGNSTPQSPAGL